MILIKDHIPRFPVFLQFVVLSSAKSVNHSFEHLNVRWQQNCIFFLIIQFVKAVLDALELHQQQISLLHWFRDMGDHTNYIQSSAKIKADTVSFQRVANATFQHPCSFQSLVWAQGRQSHLLFQILLSKHLPRYEPIPYQAGMCLWELCYVSYDSCYNATHRNLNNIFSGMNDLQCF